MINKKTWPIKLNILKREYIPTIQPMQNDIDSNVFEITMLNDFEKYDLTGLTVQAAFLKSDNTVSYLPGDITNASEGIVEVSLTSQVLAIADIVFCEIRVTGTLGEELIAPRFAFKVLPSMDLTGAVESSNEFTALTQAMGDYTAIKQQFAEVIANATVDSEVINARGGKVNLNARLDEQSAQLAEIAQEAKKNYSVAPLTKNIFDKSKVVTGKEIYTDGSVKNEVNSAVSDYMLVPDNTATIYVSGLTAYATGFNRHLWFYDSNKIPIGSLMTIDKPLTEKALTVPANAKYVNFSIYQRKTSEEIIDLNTIQVEAGTAKTSYESYQGGIEKIDGMRLISKTEVVIPPKTKGKNLLLFGDSITETATISEDGITYTEGTRSNWPTFAKSTLQVGTFWNYARSGASYKEQNIVGDIRKSISQQVNIAVTNNRPADIIVVAAGTNDGGTNIGSYATAMSKATLADLDRTNLYEAIRWVFWTIRTNYPSAVCFAGIPIQKANEEQPEALIEAITKMAKRYNFIIIDGLNESGIVREFEKWMTTGGRHLSDGLHPNIEGQKLMANLYSRVILNSLNY